MKRHVLFGAIVALALLAALGSIGGVGARSAIVNVGHGYDKGP